MPDSTAPVFDRQSPGLAAEVHDMPQMITELMEQVHERMTAPSLGMPTGVPWLDDRLSLRPGSLTVLASQCGLYGTTLALRLSRGVVSVPEAMARMLYVSLHMDRLELAKLLVADIGGIDFRAIDQGTLTESMRAHLRKTTRQVSRLRLDVLAPLALSVDQLRAVVERRMVVTHNGLRLLVVDHLGLMEAEGQPVGEVARRLKVLAQDQGVPVLALCPLPGDDAGPALVSWRSAARVADAVLVLRPIGEDEGQGPEAFRSMRLEISQNRYGPTGSLDLRFGPQTMSYVGIDSEGNDDGR